jgi:hypothetical protein
MDPELVNTTVGCGISHSYKNTYTLQLKRFHEYIYKHISKILSAYTKTQDEFLLDNKNSSTE